MSDQVVLHVARSPMTGVWSAMRTLAMAQRESATVYFGLLLPSRWPYMDDLQEANIPAMIAGTPEIFGTAAYMYHMLRGSPVRKWIACLRSRHRGAKIAVHYHDSWRAGALCVAHPSVVQVATFHGFPSKDELLQQPIRRNIHSLFARRLLLHGCRLAAVDSETVYSAEAVLGIPNGQFVLVPNGVPAPARAPLRGMKARMTVGHVGIIDMGKGWRITAHAVQELVDSGAPIEFIIAGSGPQEDEARQWCLQRPSYAKFLGYTRNARETVIPMLDVLCLPSRSEGLPMVVVEAMASGVVIVATAVGGITDALDKGAAGVIVTRTTAAVKHALASLMNPQRRRELGNAAVRRFHNLYTAERMCANYGNIYDAT